MRRDSDKALKPVDPRRHDEGSRHSSSEQLGGTGVVRVRKARVLVIDDEYRVRRFIASTLSTAQYHVLEVSSAEAALALLEQDPEFDVILCDMVMPQMTGAQLFDRLLSRHPQLIKRFAFVSAGSTHSRDDALLRSTHVRLLLKPFTPDELVNFVSEQLTRALR